MTLYSQKVKKHCCHEKKEKNDHQYSMILDILKYNIVKKKTCKNNNPNSENFILFVVKMLYRDNCVHVYNVKRNH